MDIPGRRFFSDLDHAERRKLIDAAVLGSGERLESERDEWSLTRRTVAFLDETLPELLKPFLRTAIIFALAYALLRINSALHGEKAIGLRYTFLTYLFVVAYTARTIEVFMRAQQNRNRRDEISKAIEKVDKVDGRQHG